MGSVTVHRAQDRTKTLAEFPDKMFTLTFNSVSVKCRYRKPTARSFVWRVTEKDIGFVQGSRQKTSYTQSSINSAILMATDNWQIAFLDNNFIFLNMDIKLCQVGFRYLYFTLN